MENKKIVKDNRNYSFSPFGNFSFNKDLDKWFVDDLFFNKDFRKLFSEAKDLENVFEDAGDSYVLTINFPCKILRSEDIDVNVEDSIIKIHFEVKNENSSHSGSYEYSLPEDVDVNTIHGELGGSDDNTLIITIFKKKNEPENKKIKINIK